MVIEKGLEVAPATGVQLLGLLRLVVESRPELITFQVNCKLPPCRATCKCGPVKMLAEISLTVVLVAVPDVFNA